jgi:transcriptional regulator with XRE-family HTH domain
MTVELAGPDPVDIHVGRRVRGRRRAMGVTQAELADGLGVTFQQVQKYERGHNRISASTLCRIAWRLQAQIGYFFEGLPGPAGARGAEPADPAIALGDALLASAGGAELAQAFLALKPSVRVAMVALARVASQDAGAERHD